MGGLIPRYFGLIDDRTEIEVRLARRLRYDGYRIRWGIGNMPKPYTPALWTAARLWHGSLMNDCPAVYGDWCCNAVWFVLGPTMDQPLAGAVIEQDTPFERMVDRLCEINQIKVWRLSSYTDYSDLMQLLTSPAKLDQVPF